MPLSLRLFVGGLPADHKNLGHITSAWSLFKKTMGGTNMSPFEYGHFRGLTMRPTTDSQDIVNQLILKT